MGSRPPHRDGCRHCYRVGLLGQDFQGQRASWERRREAVAIGYAAEERDFAAAYPPPTFKQYLIDNTGAGWPMSGSEPPRRHIYGKGEGGW